MSQTKHPSHYNDGKKLETWDWIEKGMTDEMFKGYLLGNCLKYLHRFEDKGKGEDLKKAKEYIEKLDKFQYGPKIIEVEPGTIVFVKHKKDPKAFEKLMKLCKRPIKNMTEEEYIRWCEQV